MPIIDTLSSDEFDRLIAYVCGESSPSEVVEMERLIAERPEWREIVARYARTRSAFTDSRVEDVVDAESAASNVIAMIQARELEERSERKVSVGTSRVRDGGRAGHRGLGRGSIARSSSSMSGMWYAAIGATLSVTALVVGWFSGVLPSQPQHAKIAATTASSRVSTYTTSNGQRATVTLPDGSRVLLNVASRLEVPVDYDRGNRMLKLNGEAFFVVAHQTSDPFTVVAGPSTTRVLGTRFVVRHYQGDTAAIVAVEDGKVAVQSTVVTAMQQVQIGAKGSVKMTSARAAQFTFPTGLLTLDGQTLAEAIPQLNRWYDADIRLGSSELVNWQIVGGFRQGSLSDLAALLDLTLGVSVVREGRVLTLYPRS